MVQGRRAIASNTLYLSKSVNGLRTYSFVQGEQAAFHEKRGVIRTLLPAVVLLIIPRLMMSSQVATAASSSSAAGGLQQQAPRSQQASRTSSS